MPVTSSQTTFRLDELCRRLGVPYRDGRYLCEKGWLPVDVLPKPGSGNHRQLTTAQAMWLAVVLKLKASGLKTPLAARLAAHAKRVGGLARHLNWDGAFDPFRCALETTHQCFLEMGDVQYLRFVTDADPSRPGLHPTPWIEMNKWRLAPDAIPIVRTQIDMSALARLLASVALGV